MIRQQRRGMATTEHAASFGSRPIAPPHSAEERPAPDEPTPHAMAPTRRGVLRAASAISAAGLFGGWGRTAQAASDGTLTVALSDNPLTCDPINMVSHDAMILSQNIWENLVEF